MPALHSRVPRRPSGRLLHPSARSCFVLSAFLLLAAATPARALLDNKGTEFLSAITPNYSGESIVELHLTADSATTVTVEWPARHPVIATSVDLAPGAITVVSLPSDAAQGWSPDAVQDNAVHMTAPDEFVAYLINRQFFTSDAALALPVDSFNNDYVVSTYDEAVQYAQFVVTAAYDDTTVTITPSNDAVGAHPKGVAFDVVLDRGEGYLVAGAVNGANGGLAGSIVTSDKPVGVTNGNGCTQVPIGTFACDTLMEVAQPTQSWGTQALAVNLPDRPAGSVYRIVASQDGTTVTRNGDTVGAIDRGGWLEVGPIAGNHVFAADKPVFVTQYMTGNASDGATTGDPAMGNVIPTAQYLKSYSFATVGAVQFERHFLTVIADNRDLDTITLDGVAIGAAGFETIPGTGWSGAVIEIAEGTHSTNSAHPHGITVSGVNAYDSYLYPGGALFQFINPEGDSNAPTCALECPALTPDRCTVTAVDDRPSEDANDNGMLDAGEDLNANGVIDVDAGIFFVELGAGSSNLSLTVPSFVPGAGVVVATVDVTARPGSGTVVATDGKGNTCTVAVSFAGGAQCGDGLLAETEQCDDGNTASGDCCAAGCTFEPEGTACGQGSECSTAGACDGAGTCSGSTMLPAGTACGSAETSACDGADSCDGEGNCAANTVVDGTACDDGQFCNGADSCTDGSCSVHAGDPCSVGDCAGCDEDADTCTTVSAGTPCTDDGDPCSDDACNGAGTCAHPAIVLAPACNWAVVGGSDTRSGLVRTRYGAGIGGSVCGDSADIGDTTTLADASSWAAIAGSGTAVRMRGTATIPGGSLVTGGGAISGRTGAAILDTVAGPVTCGDGDVPLPGGVINACGTSELVDLCSVAKATVPDDIAALDALAPTVDVGGVFAVGAGETRSIVLDPGVNVIDVARLTISRGSTLVLDAQGDASAVAIVRMAHGLTTKLRARIELAGGLQASNVLFYAVDGNCNISFGNTGAGTLFCPAGNVRLKLDTAWTGALAGGARVDVGWNVTLAHQPFFGLAMTRTLPPE